MKFLKKEINNNLTKYYFGDISMLDIQKYLLEKGYSQKEFWVYLENIKINENNCKLSFDTFLRSHIVKKQDFGNACMFLSKCEYKEKFKNLFEEIVINNSDKIDADVFDDIKLICISHDFDWLVITISKEEAIMNDFIKYISKTYKVEEVKEIDWDNWP